MSKRQKRVDYELLDQGTLWLVSATTNKAQAHLEKSVAPPNTWMGKRLVVEARYIQGLAAGLVRDGFRVRMK